MILYSITAGGVSVAALFMGGYLPGILMGLCVAGLAVFIAVKNRLHLRGNGGFLYQNRNKRN